jgi:hypothetical protein
LDVTKIPELSSIEYVLFLLKQCNIPASSLEEEMASRLVPMPETIDMLDIKSMSKREFQSAYKNVRTAKERLVACLQSGDLPAPTETQLLAEWRRWCKQLKQSSRTEADNFEQGYNGRSLTLTGAWILRHIMFENGVPLVQCLSLWAHQYYYLIMHQPITKDNISSQTSVWNHIHRLYLIDNELALRQHSRVIQRSEHGFRTLFYSSSDASIHHSRNRHVIIISVNQSTQPNKIDPSFRMLSCSVSAVKTSKFNADKCAESIIKGVGLEGAAYYSGGTNDNAPDAQNEILLTFEEVIKRILASGNPILISLIRENGVLRKAIFMGDPFHIANLVVNWFSVICWGEKERDNHEQVHHLQLMQSIHSLCADDAGYAQARLDEIMEGVETFRLRTVRERQQRWLVNQVNARNLLDMLQHRTADGDNALVAWALSYHNERSGWQQRVGGEVATWLQTPSLILGLLSESEMGSNYFSIVYSWHNQTGPLNDRCGFRMLEIFNLCLDFEFPLWNSAVKDPTTLLPKTMDYLEENFEGATYDMRRRQIMAGLTKARLKLIELSTRYLFRFPILYLVLTHRIQGPAFLRALLSLFYDRMNEDDIAPDILILDFDSRKWGFKRINRSAEPNARPTDPAEAMWFDIIHENIDEAIHFWKQLRLDSDALVHDLQKLSSQTTVSFEKQSEKDDILIFKDEYPILFECLHSAFGMMPSNSRLCEQIHGMMRQRHRKGIGMDQDDSQQVYVTGTCYEMREQRRRGESINRDGGKRPAKKQQKKSRDHNKTQTQVLMMGPQIEEQLAKWLPKAKALLAEPDHGIPLISEINRLGRRVQDKEVMKKQMDAEHAKAARVKRNKVTAEELRDAAMNATLTNDAVIAIAQDELDARLKMVKLTTNQHWKDIPTRKVYGGAPLMFLARKSMPKLNEMVHMRQRRDKRGQLIPWCKTTKSDALEWISSYNKKAKETASLIHEFLYGKGKDMTKKNERVSEKVDYLLAFGMYRPEIQEAFDHIETTPPATLRAVDYFGDVGIQYASMPTNQQTIEISDDDEVNDELNDTILAGGTDLDDDSEEVHLLHVF